MKRIRFKKIQAVSAFATIVFIAGSAFGVPGAINIQGTLEAPAGGPLTGMYDCRIRFLDEGAGGQEIGAVTRTVEFSETGRFSVDVEPPPALLDALDPGYELSVDVARDGFDPDDVFPNLVTINSVPFALRAADAENLGGQPAGSFVSSGSVSAEAWGLHGNTGAPGYFVGTINDHTLELRVNGQRALALVPNATAPITIAGDHSNSVTNTAGGAAIGGGLLNSATGATAVIAGGYLNRAGRRASVGGGRENVATGAISTIAGGYNNKASGDVTTIGGGRDNQAGGGLSTIAGGSNNMTSENLSTIGGGGGNKAEGLHSTVAGGFLNAATAEASAISGGRLNKAKWYGAVVGGGLENSAEGQASTIGGGSGNLAVGWYATVPGGSDNEANGYVSFAAGSHAKARHAGSFVWADNNPSDFESTDENQFAIRASNGVQLASDAGESGVITFGEYFRDNSIAAWAKVSSNGTLIARFGVDSVLHPLPGVYEIRIMATAVNATSLIPMAVAEIEAPPSEATDLRIVSINQINAQPYKQITIYINDGTGAAVNNDFVFVLTGR